MKKILFAFFCGLLLGLSCFAIWPYLSSNPTQVETSLAQIVYERLNEYQNEIDLEKVLSLAKDFSAHKLPLKGEKELYAPLLGFAERKVERDLSEALQNAEASLQALQGKPEIKTVVPNRVYIEVLKEGSGERISAKDPVRLVFKEYAPDGMLIKDTVDKAYTIPLSQTIKGFQLGLEGARVGETRKLYIHPEFGFGKLGRKAPNKLLIYEVTVVAKL